MFVTAVLGYLVIVVATETQVGKPYRAKACARSTVPARSDAAMAAMLFALGTVLTAFQV